MGKNKLSLVTILTVIAAIITITKCAFDDEVVPSDTHNNYEEPKSGAELTLEAIQEFFGFTEQLSKDESKRDSVIKANKPKKWVIAVGEVSKNREYTEGVLEILKDRPNLSLFKDRKKYQVILDYGKDKDELVEIQASIDSLLDGVHACSVVDLNSRCPSLKEVIVVTDKKFNESTVRCFECLN